MLLRENTGKDDVGAAKPHEAAHHRYVAPPSPETGIEPRGYAALLPDGKSGYIVIDIRARSPMIAVLRPLTAVAAIAVTMVAAATVPAGAAQRQAQKQAAAPVERSPSGTIIQPSPTFMPDGRGHARVIIIPRRRSYLDPGTEVSVGDRSFRDYVVGPAGDPGRPYWFYGPDVQGTGRKPLPSAFDGTGLNPNTPF